MTHVEKSTIKLMCLLYFNRKHATIDEDKDWITINGARVPIAENGSLKGNIGEKINKSNNEGNNKMRNIEEYNDVLLGLSTEFGVEIKSVSKHAHERALERNISPEEIADVLQDPTIMLPGDTKKGNAPTAQKGEVKIAFDPKSGQIRTVMRPQKGE